MTERLSASVAAKHIACHASANLELAIPGWKPPVVDDTAASARGTSMHEVLEVMGSYSPAEMAALAKAALYVADLRRTRRFQQTLEAPASGWWLQRTPKTKADVVLWTADELHVVDYKFGRIPVDVVDNAQLKYYALAFSPLAPKAKGVTVHVVQPLADNMEAVWLTANELDDFRIESSKAEAAIIGGDLTFGPSDHCKFCPANPHGRGIKSRPYCPAMMQMLYPAPLLDVDDILS